MKQMKRFSKRIQRQSGQALVPVIFIMFILTALAVTITTTSRREIKAASNSLKEAQQYYIARGAITWAAGQLQQATNNGATVPQLTPPPDTDSNGWTQLGDGWYKLEIIDTASRLNINMADATALSKLPCSQTDPSIAAALVDWRDADDTPTTIQGATGAELDYYQGLNPPYNAKNGPFDTIDELLLVRGITPQILYGVGGQIPIAPASETDSSGSGIPDLGMGGTRSRQAGGTGTGTGTAGAAAPIDTTNSTIPLCELVTTYSREANVAADGTKRINVKTAKQADLTKFLTDAGVSQRDTRFVSTFIGQQAQVTSIVDLLGKTDGQGRVLVAQWPDNVLNLVFDKITVTDTPFLNGLININTAPPEVLATLPKMDQTLYTKLTQLRQQGTTFKTLNDLFPTNSFTRPQRLALIGLVCTKSSVYIVRVKVRMPGTSRIYAAQALVELGAPPPQDTSTTGGSSSTSAQTQTSQTAPTPKILQWREIGRTPGWTSWAPAPNYYTNNSTGGTVGNP